MPKRDNGFDVEAYTRTLDRWLVERLWLDGPTWLEGLADQDRVVRTLRLAERGLAAMIAGTPWDVFMASEGEEGVELNDLALQCMSGCVITMMQLNADPETERALRARSRATPS